MLSNMAKETNEQKALRISTENNLDYNAVLQGMQMGDIDFQMAIAPYLGYKGEIDTDIARFHGLPQGTPTLPLKGYSVPKDTPQHFLTQGQEVSTRTGDTYVFPKEAGTVNTIGAGATAETWAHEYRHQTNEDSVLSGLEEGGEFNIYEYNIYTSKGHRKASEVSNRLLDIRNSQKTSEIKEAVSWLASNDLSRLYSNKPPEDSPDFEKDKDYFRNIILRPTNEEVREYLETHYSEFTELFDKKAPTKSSTYMKFMEDPKDKKAKSAKTFKDSL